MQRFFWFVVAIVLIGSCTKTNEPNFIEVDSNSSQVVKVEAEIDEWSQDELRMLIQNNPKVGRKPNGVKFIFNKGEKVKLHTYFKQNGQITVGTPVEATILSLDTSKKRYKAVFTLPLPATVNPANGDVFVAGAIGVKSISATGVATVEASGTLDENRQENYQVPMFFPETKINGNTTIGYAIDAHLRFYGALLEITIKSNMYDPFKPRELVFKTKSFSTQGYMDLTRAKEPTENAPEGILPSWTEYSPLRGYHRVGLDLGYVPRGKSYSFFIWVKPSQIDTKQKMDMVIRDWAYSLAPSERSEPSVISFQVKPMTEHKVYRLYAEVSSDLIYTEYHRGAVLNSVWEIYNPTNKDIDLSQYYQVRRSYDQPESRNIATNLGRNNFVVLQNNVNHSSGKFILPPGKTALYVPTTQAISNNAKSRAAYVFNYRNLDSSKSGEPFRALGSGGEIAMITKGGTSDRHIVDVFFKMKNQVYPALNVVSYMRRPDRNFPRKYMIAEEKDNDSDWVYRTLTPDWDWGYRFGEISTGKGSEYIEGATSIPAPIVYLSGGKIGNTKYQPPTYWIKGIAH